MEYILFIPFTCEGVEENAFTGKDIVKQCGGEKGIRDRLQSLHYYSLSDGDPTWSNKLGYEKETAAFTVKRKPTHCLS